MLVWWEIVGRLLISGIAGAVIGWERERKGKPAGLRTLMLVTVGAAIYALSAVQAAQKYGEAVEAGRIMSAIAQGVGFLGAGVIVQSGRRVRWLTTATSLWAAAALGYAIGMGLYVIAVSASLLVFIILHWLAAFEDRWFVDDVPQNQNSSPQSNP